MRISAPSPLGPRTRTRRSPTALTERHRRGHPQDMQTHGRESLPRLVSLGTPDPKKFTRK